MILLRPLAGLCNRLRVINSAVKLSKDARCGLKIFWQIDPEMNTAFHDLLMDIPDVRVVETDYWNLWQRAIFHRHNVFVRGAQTFLACEVAIKLASGVRPLAVSTCSAFYQGGDYSWFRPLPSIVDEVGKIASSCWGDHVVGVHIRRSDNKDSIEQSPLELFVERMRNELQRNGRSKFFVASDDAGVKKELKLIFGDAIITRRDVSNRDADGGVRDALIDLLLLAKCHKLFGSYYSSFSEVAARIGGSELEIMRK